MHLRRSRNQKPTIDDWKIIYAVFYDNQDTYNLTADQKIRIFTHLQKQAQQPDPFPLIRAKLAEFKKTLEESDE